MDLINATITLSNGEVIYGVQARLGSSHNPNRTPEGDTLIATIEKSKILWAHLNWLSRTYNRDPLPKRAPTDHYDSEIYLVEDLKLPRDPKTNGDRTFRDARALYKKISRLELWDDVDSILDRFRSAAVQRDKALAPPPRPITIDKRGFDR
ncbi:hypothetical protein IP69_19705 [Bosea sp. AAP35]|nr:hypothetical protein IP69_19705 [Bosea sp. AAP35]